MDRTLQSSRRREPLSRRSFLRMGTLGVGGLSLAEAMKVRAEAIAPMSQHSSRVQAML